LRRRRRRSFARGGRFHLRTDEFSSTDGENEATLHRSRTFCFQANIACCPDTGESVARSLADRNRCSAPSYDRSEERRVGNVTGVQTCALPISLRRRRRRSFARGGRFHLRTDEFSSTDGENEATLHRSRTFCFQANIACCPDTGESVARSLADRNRCSAPSYD